MLGIGFMQAWADRLSPARDSPVAPRGAPVVDQSGRAPAHAKLRSSTRLLVPCRFAFRFEFRFRACDRFGEGALSFAKTRFTGLGRESGETESLVSILVRHRAAPLPCFC